MSSKEFTISTWNVLADCYCRAETYSYCPKYALIWKNRAKEVIQKLIQPPSFPDQSNNSNRSTDIICLQELDDYAQIEQALKSRGYQSAFARRGTLHPNASNAQNDDCVDRSNSDCTEKRDGLCIVWRAAEWKLIDQHTIDLNDLSRAASSTLKSRFLRHNNAFMVKLQSVSSPHAEIVVCTTHLYWSPLHEDVKYNQLALIIRHLRKLYVDHPIILLGDFNSVPNSRVYRWLTNEQSSEDLPTDSDEPRFLVEKGLTKLARWLRSIGVDTVLAEEESNTRELSQKMFDQAIAENRIIITKSKTLSLRRGCPPHYQLPSHSGWEDMFAEITSHFKLQLIPERFYSRCSLCNGDFEMVPNVQAIGLQVPQDIPSRIYNEQTDENGRPLQFIRCVSCKQLYWWGSKSTGAAAKFKDMFDRITDKNARGKLESMFETLKIHQQNETDSIDQSEGHASDQSIDSSINQSINQSTDTSINQYIDQSTDNRFASELASELMNNPVLTESPIKFCSAYAEAKRNESFNPSVISSKPTDESSPIPSSQLEPEFTNMTSTFSGCLDYIFFTPQPTDSSSNSTTTLNTSTDSVELSGDQSTNNQSVIQPKWHVSVTAVEPLPTREQISVHTALPSVDWPSDHLRLTAKMRINYLSDENKAAVERNVI